jgi:D-serine deaminase-like pyridoxal phosphate-dependent protein
MGRFQELTEATRHLDPPFAVVDLPAFDANAADLVRRAGGLPIRLASKSVRVRALVDRVLGRPGFRGVLAYHLAEANWLADAGVDDVVVGYPSADRRAWSDLLGDERRRRAVTVMVDSVAHLDWVDAVVGSGHPTVQVCLDVDASLDLGPLHIGTRRSPVHSPRQAAHVARAIAQRTGFELRGIMLYEGQIAGVPDTSAAVRLMKRRSAVELSRRRSRVVTAVQAYGELRFVNGGGTGSLEVTGTDAAVTELAAGSGLFGPTLFDRYDSFDPQPAALFALPVVRKPRPGIATLYSGGYIASGPTGASRVPAPVYPGGLTLTRAEGAGEVQTPVRGRSARSLAVGDLVWMRHAKAGELCERFDTVHLVDADGTVTAAPTYRGESRNFG